MNLRRIILLYLLAMFTPSTAQAAIDLDNGDYLTWASAPVTAAPLTMYVRFSGDSFSAVSHFVALREGNDINAGGFDLGSDASAQARCYAVEAGSYAAATLASPTLSTGNYVDITTSHSCTTPIIVPSGWTTTPKTTTNFLRVNGRMYYPATDEF